MADFLYMADVQEMLGVSDSTVERMIRDGRLGAPLPHIKGGKRRWRREVVQACLDGITSPIIETDSLETNADTNPMQLGWREIDSQQIGGSDTQDWIELLDDDNLVHIFIQKHVDLELVMLLLKNAMAQLPDIYGWLDKPNVSEDTENEQDVAKP